MADASAVLTSANPSLVVPLGFDIATVVIDLRAAPGQAFTGNTSIALAGSVDGQQFDSIPFDVPSVQATNQTSVTGGAGPALLRADVAGFKAIQITGTFNAPGTDQVALTLIMSHAAGASGSGGSGGSGGAITAADGAIVAIGATTDAAQATGDASGSLLAKIRLLAKIFYDVWNPNLHMLQINDRQKVSSGSQPDSVQIGNGGNITTVNAAGQLATLATLTGTLPSGAPTALSSPPTQTNAGSATTLTFAAAVNHLTLQNNSAAVLYVDWTGAGAGLGSFQVPAGGTLFKDVHLTSLSLYTAAATNVNGATGGNIVVTGEA